MNITFGGHDFILHPSGVLYWPTEGLLVVSDLHLEKASHFAGRGYFLPPYDSHETLVRLYQSCAALSPRQILLLGDCFHDPEGHSRLPPAERGLFDQLRIYDPIWVVGNHDAGCNLPGFIMETAYERHGIVFRHEAETPSHAPEISGHFHPKVDIEHKGAVISRRCFIEDGCRLILPSFGSYTGGLSVASKPLRDLFVNKPRIYALGEKRLYSLTRQET